ncbi:MAG TPA: cytochrome c peroxidase, partial [Candidatus Polarisedimenticolia bacterium]|nr:cytochrome c peroxidase [Candidatus Polarisedimenticolia bacterium]
MTRSLGAILLAFASLKCAAARSDAIRPSEPPPASPSYPWRLPRGFPVPRVPADNPMSEAKVELGRRLFYDRALSGNGTFACATCHRQELAFTDGRARAVGSTGEPHPRGALSLANVAYAATLTWVDPDLSRLEDQVLTPMFNQDPVELGLAGRTGEMLERLRSDPRYPGMFVNAFPGESEPVTLRNVARALACFERTLLSGDSPYDRLVYGGDTGALSESALRGMKLFFSEDL